MRRKVEDSVKPLTAEELSAAKQYLKMLIGQFEQAKGELRALLDRKSNAEIRANLREYKKHHTVDGAPVSEEMARVLNAELIRRGPFSFLLNPHNRTNQKIM